MNNLAIAAAKPEFTFDYDFCVRVVCRWVYMCKGVEVNPAPTTLLPNNTPSYQND